jgi:hypothetical protein
MPAVFFAVDLNQLPDVVVKVHGMSIVGAVAYHQTVARPLLEYKLAVMLVRLTIDEPMVARSAKAVSNPPLRGKVKSPCKSALSYRFQLLSFTTLFTRLD